MRHPWQGILCGAVFAGMGVQIGHAALIAYEPFTGTSGSALNGTSGGTGWTSNWSSPAESQFSNTALSYSNGDVVIDGGGSSLRMAATTTITDAIWGSRTIASQVQPGPIYFSFLFRTSNGAGLNDDFFQLGLHTSASNPFISVGHTSTNSQGNTPTQFFARAGTPSGNSVSTGDNTANNLTYFVVAKVENIPGGPSATNYDQVTLYFNPSTLTEPLTASAISTFDTGLASFNTLVMRVARLEVGDTYFVDELRIGTTYSDVVPIPEPASVVLLGLPLLGLLAAWRARGRRALLTIGGQ